MEAERWDFTITTAHNLSAPAMRSASPRKILELVLGVLHHHCLWLKDHIRSNFSLLRLKTLFSSGKKVQLSKVPPLALLLIRTTHY